MKNFDPWGGGCMIRGVGWLEHLVRALAAGNITNVCDCELARWRSRVFGKVGPLHSINSVPLLL